jgi:plasmid stabilization system protein ParE
MPEARPWRLSPGAEAKLSDILEWTEKAFGPRQAEKYLDTLTRRIEAVAEGGLPGRSCLTTFGGDLPEDLFFVRGGMHLIVYIETDAMLIVTNFVHVSSNVADWLTGTDPRH